MFDVDLAEKRTNSKPASDRCDPKGVIAAHNGAGEDAEPISTGSGDACCTGRGSPEPN